MNKNIFKYLIINVLLLCLQLAQAQQQSDSLMHYLEIAAKNNPDVLQKYTEYQAAMLKIPQVGSLPDPELSLGVFLSPMEVLGGKQVADIRLMQMFPWFGVLSNAKDEMSLMAKAKFEQFRDTKLQVFYEVQRSYYELYKNEAQIKITARNLEILQMLERLSVSKFKSGSIVGRSSSQSASSGSVNQMSNAASNGQGMGGNANESQPAPAMSSSPMSSFVTGAGLANVYRIQLELGELQNTVELLQNQQLTLLARFNLYLNRAENSPVALLDTLRADTINISLISLSDSILTNNPMLGMLQYEQQSFDARKKMVSRMGYPMVGLGVNYSLINKNPMSSSSMNGKDMVMPMLTVTLPIYRKKYNAMRAEADLMKLSSSQQYNATSNMLRAEYNEAVQMYRDAQRRVKLYENQCLLANKSLNLMVRSFSTSGSGLDEILRIRSQVIDYEFKRVEAVVDFNIAEARLKRLANF